MKNLLFIVFLFLGINVFSQEVVKDSILTPFAVKNSYEITSVVANPVIFPLNESFLIWVESNRKQDEDLVLSYNSDYQVKIYARNRIEIVK